ncbi:MAG: hypothetical protein HYZ29_23250 [Myxococcales bacterium]|nr:hypothetical protein [Myxococcales bacterium]
MKKWLGTPAEAAFLAACRRAERRRKPRSARVRDFARFMRKRGWRWHDDSDDPDSRYLHL